MYSKAISENCTSYRSSIENFGYKLGNKLMFQLIVIYSKTELIKLSQSKLFQQSQLTKMSNPSSWSVRQPNVRLTKESRKAVLCAVCNDTASGRHYGVFTCEGCRCFFKRVNLRKVQLKCRSLGRCPVNKHFRSFCKACRYKKCCLVGMRQEGTYLVYILSLSHQACF